MQIKKLKNKDIKWWVGIISCIVLFAFIGIFGYEKMNFIWHGIKIKATVEQKDNSSIITVRGNASKAIHLTLNGREILIEKNGDFSEPISILPGFSVVTLYAKDKFGKTAEKKFEFVREENAPAIAFESSQNY